ncbi:PD-(D/E)XK nuclease domain-containing protein, partial [Hydrogenobaculum acidophilum]
TFLTKMLRQNKYYIPELENLEVGDEILSNLDVDNIMVENLLFQSGYLTIKDYKVIGNKNVFTLSYPNLEVRISFNDIFLIYLFKDDVRLNTLKFETSIITILEKKEIDKLKDILYSFFASIPHDWYRKNDIDSYEGFYASVVCALLNGAGLNIIAEDNTNKGKIDLSIILKDTVYIIEFKVVENEAQNKALTQLKEKRYYEKYMDKYKDIYLIGIEFSKSERNVVGFGWENISS